MRLWTFTKSREKKCTFERMLKNERLCGYTFFLICWYDEVHFGVERNVYLISPHQEGRHPSSSQGFLGEGCQGNLKRKICTKIYKNYTEGSIEIKRNRMKLLTSSDIPWIKHLWNNHFKPHEHWTSGTFTSGKVWGYVWSRAFSAIMKQSMWVLEACHVKIWSQDSYILKTSRIQKGTLSQTSFKKVISVHMSWSSPSTSSPGDETSSPRDERPFDGLSRKGEAGPSMRTLKVSRLTSNSFPKSNRTIEIPALHYSTMT